MTDSFTPARRYAAGIGDAVADRTVNRKLVEKNGQIVPFTFDKANPAPIDDQMTAFADSIGGSIRRERWEEVAKRVAIGNALLTPNRSAEEFMPLNHQLRQAAVLMSGRHLQHGDETQPTRNQEVFTNCSTAASSFLLFYLLLNGSGVGRCYDDAMQVVDYSQMPIVVPVIEYSHPDVANGTIAANPLRNAQHLYADRPSVVFKVPDSREGWAKAVEKIEMMTFEMKRNYVLFLDFSGVREAGKPIAGMQNRPASGPGPLMVAIAQLAKLRDAGMTPWRATMYADHYLAECVLVGGARRAARMATKTWRDKNVLDFVRVKRGGFLWSSNNSVTVDQEFWAGVRVVDDHLQTAGDGIVVDDYIDQLLSNGDITDMEAHAYRVFEAVCYHSYHDQTGEPGLINSDMLASKDTGVSALLDGAYAQSARYKLDDETLVMTRKIVERWKTCSTRYITNPCVTGDTWVHTDEGPRQVSDLIDQPFKAIVNGKSYQSAGFWKTGDKPVFKVKTEQGFEVRATADHKILVETSRKRKGNGIPGFHIQQEWVEVQDLEAGDRLVLNEAGGHWTWGEGNFDHGWLVGEIVGDGGFNPEKYPTYLRFWGEKSARQNIVDIASSAITEMEKRYVSPTAFAGPFVRGSQTTVACRALDALAATYLEPVTKRLLPAIEKAGSAFQRGFLRGFFDADGSVQGDAEKGVSVRLSQSDLSRLQVVQRMLARLGIISTIYQNRREAGFKEMPDGNGGSDNYWCEAQHELVITRSNIELFASVIGFYEEGKAAKLAAALENRVRSQYQERFTADVLEVAADGVEAVYDCTVDEVHRFDANGIVVHNCGEIVLISLGGYCVIADVVPYHAGSVHQRPEPRYVSPTDPARRDLLDWDDDAEQSFRVATRALIRVNLMDSLYSKEVKRTNRIGVGMTGFHEYAWARFGYGWKDIINEELSLDFWLTLSRYARAVSDEAREYSDFLGVNVPHTDRTMKPAGTTSKLFGLTEGAHLPSMREYLRWVQFRKGDPLIADYEQRGYPVRQLKSYNGTTIVGFPTIPEICTLGMGDKLVTAAEATPEDQYQFLRLLEKYWIRGVEADGVTPLTETGNQVSYTLKYLPGETSYEKFRKTLLEGQSTIRACSVMPQADTSAYEYQPEEPLTSERFAEIVAGIDAAAKEDVGFEHVDCASGACPISWNDN